MSRRSAQTRNRWTATGSCSDSTIKAIADAHIADRSTATLLGRAQDILRAGARQLDRRERAATEARIAEQRAKPKAEEPWKVEYRKAIEDQLPGGRRMIRRLKYATGATRR